MPVRAFYDAVLGMGWIVQSRHGTPGPRCEKWIVISRFGDRVLHDGTRRAPGL